MARIDEVTQAVLQQIRIHDQYRDVLKAKLNWSKNVLDERDAPWQIILGSCKFKFCVYVSMGLWLEFQLRQNVYTMDSPYLFGFCPDVTISRGGQRSKDIVQNIFGQKVFRREEFMLFDEDTGRVGQLGSHSIRKFSATFMRRCGCTKDEVDIRGRWKGKGRPSDVYADVELPYPDAKVAEKLCLGGLCFYAYDTNICNNTSMMNQFILSHVFPNVRRRLPEAPSLVLGKAVLWLMFSPHANKFVTPKNFLQQVKDEWDHVRGNNEDVVVANPVKRVPVQINGNQGVVYIEEIPEIPLGADGGSDHNQARAVVRGSSANVLESIQNQILALQGSVMSVRCDNHDLQSELGATKLAMERGFAIVNGNIRRIAMVPAHCRVVPVGQAAVVGGPGAPAAGGLGGNFAMMATLMTTPRSLHDLWVEIQPGVGRRKAA